MKNLPSWNLSDLYRSQSDPKINQDLKKAFLDSKLFNQKFLGKLNKYSDQKILVALKIYEQIEQKAMLPVIYANLLFAESATGKNRGSFLQEINVKYSNIRKNLLFFEIELSSLSTSRLKKIIQSKIFVNYKNYLKNLLLAKPHQLDISLEKLITDKNLTARSAWIRLFDEESASKKFNFKKDKLGQAELLSKLYSPNRSIRRLSASVLTAGFKEDIRRTTHIFNTLLLDKKNEDNLRGYKLPQESRHLANQINEQTVEAMCRSVESGYGLVSDYYRLKRAKLKVSDLFDYDRYAPITSSNKLINLKDAKKIVLDTFYDFSTDIGKIAQLFFTNRWIDFASRPGKRSGAFCSYVTPNKHPVIFMNYHGSLRDVFTLTHELGHAIHAYLMRKQNLLNYDTPLTIAETSSVFAEMLLFEKLNQRLSNNQEKYSLYASKLENIFATVFRQVAMYRFEQDIHYHYRNFGELSTETINKYWIKRQSQMFKSSVILTPDYSYWWSYVSHFVHAPFYVYSYAFGELLTLSLYSIYKNNPSQFVPRYIDLLSAGGSKNPWELVKPFGISLNNASFWSKGVNLIQQLLINLKNLSN